ncbi:hypothetical protein QQG55_13530 [Brugia pahangi]
MTASWLASGHNHTYASFSATSTIQSIRIFESVRFLQRQSAICIVDIKKPDNIRDGCGVIRWMIRSLVEIFP